MVNLVYLHTFYAVSCHLVGGDYLHLSHLTNHLPPPPSHLDSQLPQHRLLAHKDQEQEETSEQVEAVNNPEEDLKEGVVILT